MLIPIESKIVQVVVPSVVFLVVAVSSNSLLSICSNSLSGVVVSSLVDVSLEAADISQSGYCCCLGSGSGPVGSNAMIIGSSV